MKTVERFIEGLCRIGEREFTEPRVAGYIRESRVDPASLSPYLFYEPTHYTRNLIYRCDLFELIAICWEVGQGSRVHNHAGQSCWMAVPIGRLAVQNYTLVRMDQATGLCELRETSRVDMDPENPTYVNPEEPIHSVLNLAEYGQRATSLHVYSRPYDRCLVYDLQNKSYCEVPLFYDSEHGRRVAAAQ